MFKFLKWYFVTKDAPEILFTAFFTWAFICLVIFAFRTLEFAFIVFIIGIGFAFFCFVLCLVTFYIMSITEQYKEHREKEEEEILRRLKNQNRNGN